MDKRFACQPMWDEAEEDDVGYPPVVGYSVYDHKLRETVGLGGETAVFDSLEHAEIFAALMNFGAKLKD